MLTVLGSSLAYKKRDCTSRHRCLHGSTDMIATCTVTPTLATYGCLAAQAESMAACTRTTPPRASLAHSMLIVHAKVWLNQHQRLGQLFHVRVVQVCCQHVCQPCQQGYERCVSQLAQLKIYMTFNNPYICCILMYIHACTWLWIQQGTIKRSNCPYKNQDLYTYCHGKTECSGCCACGCCFSAMSGRWSQVSTQLTTQPFPATAPQQTWQLLHHSRQCPHICFLY